MAVFILDRLWDIVMWADDGEKLTDEVWARVAEGYEPYDISSWWRRVIFNCAFHTYQFAGRILI